MNLKLGIDPSLSHKHRDTCTACAGTMILEFAALSRLTGDPVFEVCMTVFKVNGYTCMFKPLSHKFSEAGTALMANPFQGGNLLLKSNR